MNIVLAIVIDLLLLGIIGFGVFYGYKKGIVKMAAEPFRPVFAFIFAYLCAGWFADLIVAPVIGAPIRGYISDFLYTNLPGITPTTAFEELPTLLKMAAGLAGVDFSAPADGVSYIDTLVTSLSDPAISVIALVISAIALFFIGKILFTLALKLVDKFFKKDGLIGKTNITLGAVFGGLIFLLISWGAAVLLSVIFHLPVFEENELIWSFDGGPLYWLFNAVNPIVLLLSF